MVTTPHIRGFTLVELLVTAALVGLVFGGLMISIRLSLVLMGSSKVSTSAVTLADARLEYIRSLAYEDIGTVGGIPNGLIPQNATTSLNGVLYHERVLIQYIDSPDDGLGGADTNGILADYKQARVEYSWADTNGTSTLFLLTDVVPDGIESTDGGGTLTVNVFDAGVLPVAGAEVRVYNNTTTTTINTIRYTNIAGIATFAGTPAAANYEITVTKPDYSIDKTYSATTSNPSPVTPHVAVLESTVSTMNFQIDELSNLLVRTVGPSVDASFSDSFDDATQVAATIDADVVGGEVVLTGAPGSYPASGSLQSASSTPSVITTWGLVEWNTSIPAGTGITVQLYSVSGTTYTLIPDGDLPGNSVGFTSGTVNIATLSPATYPTLALGALLQSSDPNSTPILYDWSIAYSVSEPSIGNVPLTLTSSKTIGLTPIYKYQESHTTDGDGELQLEDLEWDIYDVVLDTGAYDISEACANVPYTLNPNVDDTLTLTLVPASTYSLRIHVVDTDGNPVANADVDLSRSGFSASEITSSCGQAFFNAGLASEVDYEVTVQASGYVDRTITDVSIDGTETFVITLTDA